MFHLTNESGVAVESFSVQPVLHPDFMKRVFSDGGNPTVGVGWVYKGGKWSAPVPIPFTKMQLMLSADYEMEHQLGISRSYPIDGLSTPMSTLDPYKVGEIFDDANPATMMSLMSIYQRLAVLTYPYIYNDEHYSVWSLTQAQLKQFIEAVFAHVDVMWAFYSAVIIPGVASGTIVSRDDIEALPWPK